MVRNLRAPASHPSKQGILCHDDVAGWVLPVSMQLAKRHVSSMGRAFPRNMLARRSTCWLGRAADRFSCLGVCRRPKRHAGRSTTEGFHQAVLRQRMAMPLPQDSAPSQRGTGGQAVSLSGPSTGPSHLASSLARLQQLEDNELRGPSPKVTPLLQEKQPPDAAAVNSVRRGSGSISGICETSASSAHHELQKAECIPTSKAEQMLPLALRRHVADLGNGANSRGVLRTNPPAPSPHRGEHEEREEASQSMQSTLAAGLPKLEPQVIRPAAVGQVAGIEKLTQPIKDM